MQAPSRSLHHVIIGTGEAGLACAMALREDGQENVVLIGAEEDAPYERPPLSKPSGGYHRPVALDLTGIVLRRGSSVTQIDPADRYVMLSSGLRLHYDRLLIATGARARGLDCTGAEHALPLRNLSDARAIYARADTARAQGASKAVIIGAGLIGLELAAEFTLRGMNVTVLEAGPRALGRAVPETLAQTIAQRHQRAGVALQFGVSLAAIDDGGVHCTDGHHFPADVVIAAVGAEPEQKLAQSAGLACDNGILTDARLCTNDPAIFSAGDCARICHPRYGLMRFESWRMACDQGRHAAAAMMGGDTAFAALPWFWSDHYDLGLQAVGLHDPSRPAVVRPLEGGIIRFECAPNGELAAAQGLGQGNAIARDIRLAEMLIARGIACDPDWLADPNTSLKAALRTP
jgi:3-phenylpropionate/trans-cinnamate dioxygenase ferredoxin reductase subunit